MQIAQTLSRPDWLMLIEAWWRLFYFRAALRVTSYQRLDDFARAADSSARRESSAPANAENLHRLVRYAAQLYPVPMTCLEQSLTLQKMLRRQNIPAQIRIGAHKVKGALYAHAWVEVRGKPVGETADVLKKFNILAAVEVNSGQFI